MLLRTLMMHAVPIVCTHVRERMPLRGAERTAEHGQAQRSAACRREMNIV